MKNRLHEEYKTKVIPTLLKRFNLKTAMEAPTLKKIVLNSGVGGFKDSSEAVEGFINELSLLAGQRPVVKRARLSESGFKIRKGDVVGVSLTLRGRKMWSFLDKLINIVLPRVRDFKGLDIKSFDANGNYSMGLTEHTIFPEVNPNTVKGIRGLQVTVVTSTKDVGKSEALLTALGMPFRKE